MSQSIFGGASVTVKLVSLLYELDARGWQASHHFLFLASLDLFSLLSPRQDGRP